MKNYFLIILTAFLIVGCVQTTIDTTKTSNVQKAIDKGLVKGIESYTIASQTNVDYAVNKSLSAGYTVAVQATNSVYHVQLFNASQVNKYLEGALQTGTAKTPTQHGFLFYLILVALVSAGSVLGYIYRVSELAWIKKECPIVEADGKKFVKWVEGEVPSVWAFIKNLFARIKSWFVTKPVAPTITATAPPKTS